MQQTNIELIKCLNDIKKLDAKTYSNLLSVYGEELLNKTIEQLIDENSGNLSKFDYYVSKITSYDDAVAKSIFDAYGIDLSLIETLSKEVNIELATEIYYILKELNYLMLEMVSVDDNFEHSWISDKVDRCILECNDKAKLNELKCRYNEFLVKRNKIVEGNLRLVITVAKKFNINESIFAEAIQYGNMGLMRAVEKYSPSYGVTFATYAYYWIRQSITRSIYNVINPVSVPAHQVNIYYRMKKVQRKLSNDLGRDATDEEIAKFMNIDEEDVKILRRAFNDSLSLYEPLGGAEREEDSMLINFIEDENASVSKELFDAELNMTIREKMNNVLTSKEKFVIERRFGFYDGNCLTLEQVGQELGVSRERVRQIEKRVIGKLSIKFKDLKNYMG